MGVLTVYLDKVTHLKDEDSIGGNSDPYVVFELERDNLLFDKDFGEKKSSKKTDESSPSYGETFKFEFDDEGKGLKNMELKCKIMDDDVVGDDKVGKCKFELEDLKLGPQPKAVDKVVDRNFFSKSARVYLKLSYKK